METSDFPSGRMFDRKGRKYDFADKLTFALTVNTHTRAGKTLGTAVAIEVDDDHQARRSFEKELSETDTSRQVRFERQNEKDRDAAISSGCRRYHECQSAVLAVSDAERIARTNFAAANIPVAEIVFRFSDGTGNNNADAMLAPLGKRGRPQRVKNR